MKPFPSQIKVANEAYPILSKYGLVYLGMEERTGKTLSSILLAEKTTRTRVLVLTKKSALMGELDKDAETAKEGWYGTFNKYGEQTCTRVNGYPHWSLQSGTAFTVLNYHAIHTAVKGKSGKRTYKLNIKPKDYDLIILDEPHAYLAAYPKLGAIWKSTRRLTKEQPIILQGATPYAQGYQLLYNQLRLSDWSPFRAYANFYRFFDAYGISQKIKTDYGLQETYKKCKPLVWAKCKHLFITYTRKELGFEHEPEDIIHYVELSEDTKAIYNDCMTKQLFITDEFESMLDSSMKLRTTLHMIEGGVAKVDDEYFVLDNDEIIQQILEDFGDSKDLVIFYHYKAQLAKLEKYFKNAVLAQATSKAEGVDYSMYEHMAVYSQDFSTARHSQRRARQANKLRMTPIKVHFYLVKGAISEQVYKTVAVNKVNFVDSLFIREKL